MKKAIRSGLKKAKIANRIEEIVDEEPTIIFDWGHNPEGIEALATTLRSTYPSKKSCSFSLQMKDKNIKEMLQPLSAIAEEIILLASHMGNCHGSTSCF
ncbi:hypothetical protein KHA80_17000 [Anaerobacillus sp. HL2]|nr:hypothetical protein KHA80_17000 [Anaerobacillus sp. HL2]